MSDRSSRSDRLERAEQLLSAWPEASSDEPRWVAMRESILRRVAEASPVGAEELLTAPLPRQREEPEASETTASLLQLGERSLPDGRGPAETTQDPSKTEAREPQERQRALQKRGRRLGAFAAVASLAAVAAAVALLYIRTPTEERGSVSEVRAGAPLEPTPRVLPVAESVPPGDSAPPHAIDTERAKVPPANASRTTRAAARVAVAKSTAKKASAPNAPEAESTLEGRDPAMKPASGPSDLLDHPTTGAVQAAVSGPLARARLCAAGLAGPISVSLTFAASGRVQDVQVGPPARGTPAESCIANALASARTEPFARSNYSVPLRIIPAESPVSH